MENPANGESQKNGLPQGSVLIPKLFIKQSK